MASWYMSSGFAWRSLRIPTTKVSSWGPVELKKSVTKDDNVSDVTTEGNGGVSSEASSTERGGGVSAEAEIEAPNPVVGMTAGCFVVVSAANANANNSDASEARNNIRAAIVVGWILCWGGLDTEERRRGLGHYNCIGASAGTRAVQGLRRNEDPSYKSQKLETARLFHELFFCARLIQWCINGHITPASLQSQTAYLLVCCHGGGGKMEKNF